MSRVTLASLTDHLQLADELLARRESMFEPQDLPGRYGRVVHAVDHLLNSIRCEAVLGGWAVWRHGYLGRVTQDLDIALPADAIDDFLKVAAVSGFELLPRRPGRWHKLVHKDTGIQTDILPEGGRPGTASKPAPTTIPHPSKMGAAGHVLRYMTLPALVELKIATGRARDHSDVVELIRANPDQVSTLRQHLTEVHAVYVKTFDQLTEQSREQGDE